MFRNNIASKFAIVGPILPPLLAPVLLVPFVMLLLLLVLVEVSLRFETLTGGYVMISKYIL